MWILWAGRPDVRERTCCLVCAGCKTYSCIASILYVCVYVCVHEVNIIILLLPSTSAGLLKTLAFEREREGVRERKKDSW